MHRRFAIAALVLTVAGAGARAQDGIVLDGAEEPAFTLDTAACPNFLAGIWLATSQQDVGRGGEQALWHVTEALVLDASGVLELAFASGIAGDETEETKSYGVWAATAGARGDRCALTLSFDEGESWTLDVTASSRTRMQAGGQAFTRAR